MDKTTGPVSVGIIMDGNRRWAKDRDLPTIEGHRRGAETLKEVAGWADEQGIEHLIVYAFSTENWKRDPEEIEGLTKLLEDYIREGVGELADKASIRFIGETERFPGRLQELMKDLEDRSSGNGRTVSVALSYGGRADIVQAANSLISEGSPVLTEELLSERLYTAGLPDPDLIIRTGGQQRLSNFLAWQSVYSELVFSDTLWPALSKDEFEQIIQAFRERKRNFGA